MIEFIKETESRLLRNDLKIDEFLTSSDWAVLPEFLGRNYQCLFNNDGFTFSSGPLIDGRVNDLYKINSKATFISNELKKIGLPDKTLLLGCLYHPDFSLLTRMISQDISNSLALQKVNKLYYYIYDIPYFDNYDLRLKSYSFRREVLDELFDNYDSDLVQLVDYYLVESDKKLFFDECQKNNQTLLFNNIVQPYESAKVYKYINPYVFKAVITDINVKNNLAYSMSLGMYRDGRLVDVGNATGFTFMQSKEFASNKPNYIGKVVNIKTRFKGKSKLKNPKFMDFYDLQTDETEKLACKW